MTYPDNSHETAPYQWWVEDKPATPSEQTSEYQWWVEDKPATPTEQNN